MPKILTAALVAFLPAAAVAEQTTYVCRLDTRGVAYLPEEMVIGTDDETGLAVIADPIVMYVRDEPLTVPVEWPSEKKMTFRWELPLSSRTGQTTIMKYNASLQFPSMRLTVYAVPSGYANRFRAQGGCAITLQTLEDLE